jgi:hypothetical protein
MLLVVALAGIAPARAGWRTCFVVDHRLSVLRSRPDLLGSSLKRLRVGRRVYEVGRQRDGEGRLWLRVAVTRRTRGWLLADSVAAPGQNGGAARLRALLAEMEGFDRIEVACVALEHFPDAAPEAREALRIEVAAQADALAQRANRRLGPLDGKTHAQVRALLLSDPGLDRFNRLGIRFDVDPATRRYVPK